MGIDKSAIEKHTRGILIALGDNPDREGLKDTPMRVAKMYEELFDGMNYTNDQIAKMFNKTFTDDLEISKVNKCEDGIDSKYGIDNMVIMKDIDIFSFCEHHLALMYNMKVCVAYIPNQKIIGLSKISRIVDMVGKRLQLQERIGTDIAEIIKKIIDTNDIAIIIEGEHSCMTARGIKKAGTKTITTLFEGKFKTDSTLASRLLAIYN